MMDDEYYDLCYDAWMSGSNPDNVSEDDYEQCISQGYYPDEISLTDVLREPQVEPEQPSSTQAQH
jgi:hypothetical protein